MRTIAAAFFTGVALLQFLPALPAPPLAAAVPAVALAALRWRALRVPAWALAGFGWAWLHAALVLGDTLAAALEDEIVTVEGVITGIPVPAAHRTRLQLAVARAEFDGVPRRIRLDWYDHAPALGAGERWRLTVRLRRPHGLRNPGGTDFERSLFQQRLGATGYVLAASTNRRLAFAPTWHLDAVRERLAARIDEVLGPHPLAGVVVALAVGERGGIRTEQWQVLQRTGTSHLVAISGLHIGLTAAFAWCLGRWAWAVATCCGNTLAAPRAGAVLGLVGAVSYAALAGWTVPTQRALVAVAVVMLGRLLLRRFAAGDLYAGALLAVLVWDPLAVLAAGFWLSFAAAAVILFRVTGRTSVPGAVGRVVDLQFAIALGMAPLTLLLFTLAPAVGPIANLIAVPWTGLVVVPLVLSGSLVLPWAGPFGACLLTLAADALQLLWWLLEHLATWPFGVWRYAAGLPAVLAAAVGVMVLLAPRGTPGRWLAALWLLPLLLPRIERPAPGDLWLTLLDVGQGLAAVVQTRHSVLVFDAGPRFRGGLDTGTLVVAPYLEHLARRRIDTLVVSHGDLDHIGGAGALFERFEVGRLLTSVPERLAAHGAVRCRRGQAWQRDGVRFEMLHPPAGWSGSDNEGSCVLRVTGSGGTVLLTADIERRAEQALLAAGPLVADVVVVAHHGSATSSSEPFVAALGARHALVPAGYRNRFGFPASAVVERYRRHGAEVLVSGISGAIEIRLGAAASAPIRERERSRRYWHAP
ncbi:MAG: DNA internalization-related competence protein ComEC/Rec2 [Gammaproteobacteria bacterium]|nr:DNA internalization-related competence protein ComEC/Rec2 [Gammaproteobacteria bacterium]